MMQPIRHEYTYRPLIRTLVVLVISAWAIGWATQTFPIGATPQAWHAWQASIVHGTFRTTDLVVDDTQNIGGLFTSTFAGSQDPDFNQLIAMKLNGEMGMLLNSTGSDGNDVQLFMRYEANARVGETININNFLDGTFDTTASGVQAIGVQSIVDGHKIAGSNPLNNVAFDATAGSGDDNYSFFGHAGFMRNDGDASFFDTSTHALLSTGAVDFTSTPDVQLGFKVESFTIPGSPTTTPTISIGIASHVDGTGVQVKNTLPAAGISGIEIAGDTTLNAGIETGYFLYRGAGGGIGGSVEGVVALDSGGRALVGANANDMVVANETVNKRLLFSADGTGFSIGAALDTLGNLFSQGAVTHNAAIGSTITGGFAITGGSGAPAINCNNGDLYTRSDGSTNTTLYVCTASNTWTAK